MLGITNWGNKERVARFGEYIAVVAQMLNDGVTSFSGDYYSTSDAVMSPGSHQSPRLPLTVAAMMPKMMKLTAEHADIWNSLHFDRDFEVQLPVVAERVSKMEELCEEVGRDPATLRHSFTIFDADSRASGGAIRYYDNPDLFIDLVQRLTALGMSEISIYYPMKPDQLPKLEHIFREIVPDLRAEYASKS